MQPRKLQGCIQRINHQASDFRDFVCSVFPKAILFDFYVKMSILVYSF